MFAADVSMDYASFIMGDDTQETHQMSEPDFATSAESSVAATPAALVQSNDDSPISRSIDYFKFTQETVPHTCLYW